jgi:hypothetical protein
MPPPPPPPPPPIIIVIIIPPDGFCVSLVYAVISTHTAYKITVK